MKHPHAEWIKRWADGEEIQWKNADHFTWSDLTNSSSWDEFPEYTQFRVKPMLTKKYARLAYDGIRLHIVDGETMAVSNLEVTLTNGKIIDVKYLIA